MRKTIFIVFVIFIAYFGLELLPEWKPELRFSSVFVGYSITMPLVVLLLFVLAICSFIAGIIVRLYGKKIGGVLRGLIIVPIIGCLAFLTTLGIEMVISQGLPPGSHVLEFDQSTWKHPDAFSYVENDITPRQKMLGAVVNLLHKEMTQQEVEALLGTSRDTPYFKETGRDLIYMLGPERGFFGIDSEWLLIYFNDSGYYDHYEICTD